MINLEIPTATPERVTLRFVCNKCQHDWGEEVDAPIDWKNVIRGLRDRPCPKCGTQVH